jgi:hypothetical protein
MQKKNGREEEIGETKTRRGSSKKKARRRAR